MIVPAARLGAAAAVSASVNEIGRNHASSGIGHAHCAVDERFDFHFLRNSFPEFDYFIKGHFPAENNPFCAHVPINLCGIEVKAVCLGGNVDFKFRRGFVDFCDKSDIGNNYRIDPGGIKKFCIIFRRVDFFVFCEAVHRDVKFYSVFVGIFYRFGNSFPVKTDVVCAKLKKGSADINRIGAEMDRSFKTFHISRRSKKFGSFHQKNLRYF